MAIETVDLREILSAGRGTITDFSPSAHIRPRPPDLLIGAVTPELTASYFRESLVIGASLMLVRDVEVLREGILLIDGSFGVCSHINIDPGYRERWHPYLADHLPGLSRRTIEGEVVLLAGIGHTVYGHWIVDFLPKLYLLHRAGYRLARLRFLIPANTPDFARAWLALLGIAEHQLVPYDPWTERLACRSLLVPGALRHGSRVAPIFAQARAFLLRRLDGYRGWWRRAEPGPNRLFIARASNPSTLNDRRLIQRELLEGRAAAHGFTIVRPESLDIAAQVAQFRSARVLVGEYGSGLHASLFARLGATILSVRNGEPLLGFLQTGIDHAVGHDSGYVIGGLSEEDGSFSVDAPDIDDAFAWLGWRRPR